jgi:hypothetical protein
MMLIGNILVYIGLVLISVEVLVFVIIFLFGL